jgi:excisionase family DNA binding protein
MKPFLSIKDASEYLGLEYKTVYRLVRAGEIPAARLGGVYRIKFTDLENYFEQQKQRVLSRSGEKQDALLFSGRLVHCGRDFRVIRNEEVARAEKCQTPGCSELLCQQCYSQGARHCYKHEPPPDGSWRRAAEQAREMELAYIGRFDMNVRECKVLPNPFGNPVSVADWDAAHQTRDETSLLKRLLAQAALPEPDLAIMPLNTKSIYSLIPGSRKKTGLVINVAFCARLAEFLESGLYTSPLSLADLLNLLREHIHDSEKTNRFCVCAFASPTGWAPEAIEYLEGRKRKDPVFHNRLVLPFLVDLAEGELYYDRNDKRLTAFEPLFHPLRRPEQIREVTSYVETHLLTFEDTLTSLEVMQGLSLSERVIQEAFLLLRKDPRYTVIEQPDNTMIIGLTE